MTSTETPQSDLVPLRRNWRFQGYWLGTTVGAIGTSISLLVYPLLALSLTGSALLAGLLAATQPATAVLLGIPVGALADRFSRRNLLLVSEALRTLVTVGVLCFVLMGGVDIVGLFAGAVTLGVAGAIGMPVRRLALRSIVPPEQLRQAMSQDEVRVNIAMLTGPPLAGVLFAVGSAQPFVVVLACFAASMASAFLTRLPTTGQGVGRLTPRALFGGATAGPRILWKDPVLRSVTGLMTLENFIFAALNLILINYFQKKGVDAQVIGLALSGEAVGYLTGAALVARLHQKFRPGILLLGVVWISLIMTATLLFPASPVRVFFLLFAISMGKPALYVLIDVIVFHQVDDAVRGRVISGSFTVLSVGAPLGSAAAGLLLGHLAHHAAIALLCLILLVPLGAATTSSKLRSAHWPA
ncbi:MFS transporter (plasmid) [Streptomyces sp. BHT-5-2]|uniref:MFS transporter n=1 Tax=Streptomyces sp. BHT-5-2 TaxID=2866715 RepID=UPI001C8E6E1B|nr:MFS transporter [Streptomyces sp. BHT-5-2]QZL08779.1 MFS transporter [Streptomyces sp. BHT-5-2]